VGVEERKPLVSPDVLPDHRLEQSGFPGAGLADGVDVMQAVGLPDAEGLSGVAVVGSSEEGDWLVGPGRHLLMIP